MELCLANSNISADFESAVRLRSIITACATGGLMDEDEYCVLRSVFINDPISKRYLPRFVRENINGEDLRSYLKSYHSGSGAYAARRQHISSEFRPLLDFLSDFDSLIDLEITERLRSYDADGVLSAWQKALLRRKSDPEGAITAARTLLEEVCKHILEDANVDYSEKWDLPKIYNKISIELNIAPSNHSEEVFKRILGGCQTVVENLGALRNKTGDAHGLGRKKVKPSERHAALAVNLAGSMAMFLVETWVVQQKKANTKKNISYTKQDPVVYKDIYISSRHDLASEIQDMKRIIDALNTDMIRRIDAIWCDSKACALYNVTVRDGLWVPELQWAIADAGLKAGGYNGFYFDGDAPRGVDLDPCWGDAYD